MANASGARGSENPQPTALLPLALASLATVAFVLRERVRFSGTRHVDTDEFQHLHIAWCIAHGQVPYRDFFDHHLPLLHLLLAPLFRLVPAEQGFAEAARALFIARGLSLGLACGALVLTFFLGRAWRGPAVGLFAMALLAPARAFVDKSTEIRPDVLALVLILAALLAAIAGSGRVALCGLLFGAGLMASPKVVFVLPALLIAVAASPGPRVRRLAVFAGVAAIPIVVVLAFVAPSGNLEPLFRYVVDWNARWQLRFSPGPLMLRVLHESPLLALGGLTGGLWLLPSALRDRNRNDATLVVAAAGFGAALFTIPVPYLQSFLPLFPLFALFAAHALNEAVARLGLRDSALSAALAVVLVLNAAHALAGMETIDRYKAAPQLAQLRWVMNNTNPTDAVLDTWTGLGVFRPHAWFYFALPDDVRAMLPADAVQTLARDLESGALAPRLIVSDEALGELSPELPAIVERRYEREEAMPFWMRRPD